MIRFTIAVFSILLAGSAQANVLTNGSFEVPLISGIPSLAVGDTSMGWEVITGEIAQICGGCSVIVASDGGQSLDLSGFHDAFPWGGVQQTFATIPFAVYSIHLDVNSLAGTSSVSVSAGDLFDTASSSTPANTWTTYSGFFTAQGSTTTLQITGTASGSGNYIGLDNVVVDLGTSIPEPSTLGLLALGALLIRPLRRAIR